MNLTDSNKPKRIGYYFHIWLLMTKNAFQVLLAGKVILALFLVAKVLRFVFFVSVIFFILKGSETLAGYNMEETIFFFLTFTLIDTIVQFLFRNVYHFRHRVVSGEFDLALVKPMNPLFQALLGGADIIDLITLPPLVYATWYVGTLIGPTPLGVVVYMLLIANGLVLATAFHIFVLGFGIVTLEVDHTVMIYRDLTSLGRLPVDIYKEPLRGIITYLIPIGLMMTIPAKGLLGLVSPLGILLSFGLGAFVFWLSLRFWNFALTKYTSASS